MSIPFLPFLCATALLAAPQQEGPEAAKARLKSTLDATGLTYKTSASGLSFTLVFDQSKQRKQTVYVAVTPSTLGALRTHLVYTTVWLGGQSAPDETTMRKALLQSKKLGSFYFFQDTKGSWAIRFCAHFEASELQDTSSPQDPHTKRLKDLIFFVNQVGDETDLVLNGPDKDIR